MGIRAAVPCLLMLTTGYSAAAASAAQMTGAAGTSHSASSSFSTEVAKVRPWDLDQIFTTEAEWGAEQAQIRALLQRVGAATKVTTAQELATLLSLTSEARGRSGRLTKVGILQRIIDQRSDRARTREEDARALEKLVLESTAFVEPMIRSIGEAQLRSWMAQEPQLRPHRRRIDRTLVLAPHSAPAGTEKLIAQLTVVSSGYSEAYSQIMGGELDWPSVGGEKLNTAAYANAMRSTDRAVRTRAAESFLFHLGRNQNLLGLLLVKRIETDMVRAGLRGTQDPANDWLFTMDGMKLNSYKAMFTAVRNARPHMRKAAAALAKLHGAERLSFLELFAPTPQASRVYKLEEVEEDLLRGFEVLGQDYSATLKQRFEAGWIHAEPGPSKGATSGVYWHVGGGHPHGILSFRGDLASARLYGAISSLMMGYAAVPGDQAPDVRSEDFPLFSNAVWYFGFHRADDALLSRQGATCNEQIAVRAAQLANLLRVYVRGTAMAELEMRIAERIARGEGTTGMQVSSLFRSIVTDYLRDTGIVLHDHEAHLWATVPALFSGPHHAAFTMAMATAIGLEDGVTRGDRNSIDAVRYGMGKSQRHLSQEVLDQLGMDLSSPDAYNSMNRRIETLSDWVEIAAAEQGRTCPAP